MRAHQKLTCTRLPQHENIEWVISSAMSSNCAFVACNCPHLHSETQLSLFFSGEGEGRGDGGHYLICVLTWWNQFPSTERVSIHHRLQSLSGISPKQIVHQLVDGNNIIPVSRHVRQANTCNASRYALLVNYWNFCSSHQFLQYPGSAFRFH